MKPENIVEGKSYEVTMGKSPNAVVVVREKNLVTKTWLCVTADGKEVAIKNPDRFLKSVKVRPPKSETEIPEPAEPQEKPKKVKSKLPVDAVVDAPTVDPETAKQLIQNRNEALKRLGHAKASFDYGWVGESLVRETQAELDAATGAMYEAGLRSGRNGRSNGRMSGLDAAYQVLLDEGRSLRAMEIYNLATERNYCDLTGATPWSTISAALTTDIAKKGDGSRFKKDGVGLFAINENFNG